MELYKDKSNLKVVNASIFSKAYTDESILLKELIYPDKSRLPANLKFNAYSQKWNIGLNQFTKNFWNEVDKKSDPSFTIFLNKLNVASSALLTPLNVENTGGGEVSIYFPYSLEFLPEDGGGGGYYEPITSITTATANGDEGWGNQPYFINGAFQNYVQVLINDDYAFSNPTQIVGVNGIDIFNELLTPPPPPPPLPPGSSRIYVGEGTCNKQYDRLISFTGNGGGSEIKYCHMTGYLQPVNGQVTSFQDIVSVDFSRRDIKKIILKKNVYRLG